MDVVRCQQARSTDRTVTTFLTWRYAAAAGDNDTDDTDGHVMTTLAQLAHIGADQVVVADSTMPAYIDLGNVTETAELTNLFDSLIANQAHLVTNAANEAVSNSEAIKKFTILPLDLTIDNGYLTPKLSIRRHLIVQDFASDIDSLYA
jgi:long-subunit acyl-CoA synthetase (AMP-forming)